MGSQTNAYGEQETTAQEVLPIVGQVIGSFFGPGGGEAGRGIGEGIGNTIATGDAAGAPQGTEAAAETDLGGLFSGQGLGGFFSNFLLPQITGGPTAGEGGGSLGFLEGIMGAQSGAGNYPATSNNGSGKMGSSPLGGGKDGSSSTSSDSGLGIDPALTTDLLGLGTAEQGLASQDIGLSGAQENLAGLETGYGVNVLGPAYSQYAAGATGSLTPAQQALVTQALGNMNLGTMANYANLGLGGSTMEQQDLNANQLSSLSQQAGLEAASEQQGLQALQEGLGFLGQGSGALGASGTSLSNAAGILNNSGALYEYLQNELTNQSNTSQTNKANALSALGSGLGGSSSSGSSASGLGGLLGNLFGGGSSTGDATSGVGGLFDTSNLDALC